MMRLRNLDAGFSRSGIVTMSLLPLVAPDGPPAQRSQFWKDVLDRVRALPAVTSASASVLTPLLGKLGARGRAEAAVRAADLLRGAPARGAAVTRKMGNPPDVRFANGR